jgi:uncharacterized integral membrane protein
MRLKTIFIIGITALLTVVIMQNKAEVPFHFLFSTFFASNLVVMLSVAVVAFIIGVITGRPAGTRHHKETDLDSVDIKKRTDTLSKEDRDYIS